MQQPSLPSCPEKVTLKDGSKVDAPWLKLDKANNSWYCTMCEAWVPNSGHINSKGHKNNVNWYYVDLTRDAGYNSPAVKVEVCYKPADYTKLWEFLKTKSGNDAYASPSGSGTSRSGGSAESQPNTFKAAASRGSKDGCPSLAEVGQLKADVENLKKNVMADVMHKTKVDKLKQEVENHKTEVDKLKAEVESLSELKDVVEQLKAQINTLRQDAASEIRQAVGQIKNEIVKLSNEGHIAKDCTESQIKQFAKDVGDLSRETAKIKETLNSLEQSMEECVKNPPGLNAVLQGSAGVGLRRSGSRGNIAPP